MHRPFLIMIFILSLLHFEEGRAVVGIVKGAAGGAEQ